MLSNHIIMSNAATAEFQELISNVFQTKSNMKIVLYGGTLAYIT